MNTFPDLTGMEPSPPGTTSASTDMLKYSIMDHPVVSEYVKYCREHNLHENGMTGTQRDFAIYLLFNESLKREMLAIGDLDSVFSTVRSFLKHRK